ncbi:d-tyrosyl-tRNA(Tyr) deacylase [Firmicutes bacterium CAG:194]|jgi:D-tyrosyl-tRNA(Tyr) deacylase|nr:D-aminoacyl-tRNA deacylase [Bacillota bacterium]OLA29502.1 MAG: D-tyrosyl-tRNA(Tyr) deacylase [Firmicutes bacterium CAG_194_44_15]CCZ28151.1 d-tyrosyl-tRNA(Tyr) deacylase [Firmicutes bacterium CAG:194]
MRFVIQRVSHAQVTIDGQVRGSIQKGYMVLIGIGQEDTEALADRMIAKMLDLRIFEDADGKSNLSLRDVDGALLLISQFTLYADCKKGKRPSFFKAGEPHMANDLYEYIIRKCKEEVRDVERGEFGAMMHVELLNEGPFTIILDSAEMGWA